MKVVQGFCRVAEVQFRVFYKDVQKSVMFPSRVPFCKMGPKP